MALSYKNRKQRISKTLAVHSERLNCFPNLDA